MERAQKPYISALQFFSLLFISRAVIMITLNNQVLGGERLIDNVVSSVIAFGFNFIIIIPIWLLHRRRPTLNVVDYSYYLMGSLGVIIPVFYSLYFLIVNCYYMSFFQLFIVNVMDPKTPLWLVAVAVLLVAVYGAFKGIEAIARASGFIIVIVVAGLLFIILSLTPQIDPINYEPFFYDGFKQTATGTLLAIARTSCPAVIALILPLVKGRKKLGYAVWNTGIYLLMICLILVMVGALGGYLKNQLFPVYTASSIAEAGAFQRFDAIFLSVWMTGLFLKTSLDLFLISFCVKRFAGDKASKITIVAAAVLIMALTLLITNSVKIQAVFYNLSFLLSFTVTAILLIPLVLLIWDSVKSRKEGAK